MRLGFYSELGRADVVAVREFIAARGHGQGAEDIRRCRQELMSFADGTPLGNVSRFADFFSSSECRDLLFHVQEHRLTLPAINAFLAGNRLEFLGFELDARTVDKYRKHHAGDENAVTDLDRWHAFETDNPVTVASMYQFWIRKNGSMEQP